MRGVFIILFLVLIMVGLASVALFSPTRLGLPQEVLMGVVHRGVVNEREETVLVTCAQVEGRDGLWAFEQTTRQVFFADGSSMMVVVRGVPQPGASPCP